MLQPSSIDVRLDRFFRVFENHRYPHIDPAADQSDLTREVEPDGDEPFILHPGEFVLGSTYEVVSLPDDIAARVEGKSSLGRLGLLTHATAGFVDPGFSGHVTLELANVATLPIKLYPGMKIGQFCFFRLTSPASTRTARRSTARATRASVDRRRRGRSRTSTAPRSDGTQSAGVTVAVLGGPRRQGRGAGTTLGRRPSSGRRSAAGLAERRRRPRPTLGGGRPGATSVALANEDAAAARRRGRRRRAVDGHGDPRLVVGRCARDHGRRRLREPPAASTSRVPYAFDGTRQGSGRVAAAGAAAGSTVVAAFHHVSAGVPGGARGRPDGPHRGAACCGDDRDATTWRPRSPTRCPGMRGCTSVGCATRARSRRSPPT